MSLAAPLAIAPPRAAAPPYEAAPIVLALLAFALCAFSPAVLNDGDTWSHVATGNWILDHRAVPHVDPFTFSFAGAPWTAHEWLSEVLLALAWRGAGWGGVTLITGAAAGAAMYLLMRRVARDLTGPALVVVAALAFALLAPSFLARPHMLAFPILALWSEALLDAREKNRAPPLALAALMALWANLHGGFAFGLALIALFAAEALWEAPAEARLNVFRDWVLFGLVSLGAALLTPFGVEGLLFPLKLLDVAALAQINEWQPEDFAHPNAMEFALLALIGLALVKPVRLAPMRVLLLVGLIHMSLQHIRHEMLLATIAPMLLAKPIANALDAHAPSVRLAPKLIAGALALAALLMGARLALPIARGDSATSPKRALEAVPAALRDKPMLNSYAFGGYFIFEGLRPFIDGRADMFGDAFLGAYSRLLGGDAESVEDVLKRHDIAWTIFAPGQKIVARLDHEPGWKRLYADKFAVVHVRDDAAR